MWPKSRPPTALYQSVRDAEQQKDDTEQAAGASFFSKAPDIPKHLLLGGDNAIKQEQLLRGDNKLNESLLLGGNKSIADHLLLMPRKPVDEEDIKDEDDLGEETDFEHLDYLEPSDDMPLTSRRRFQRKLPNLTVKSASIAATLLVLLVCLVAAFFAVGGKKHPLGPGDYRV